MCERESVHVFTCEELFFCDSNLNLVIIGKEISASKRSTFISFAKLVQNCHK